MLCPICKVHYIKQRVGKVVYDEFGPVFDDPEEDKDTKRRLYDDDMEDEYELFNSDEYMDTEVPEDVRTKDDFQDFEDVSFSQECTDSSAKIMKGNTGKEVKQVNKVVTSRTRPISNLKADPK